jgi:signal recognition particle receptor subunit alpha
MLLSFVIFHKGGLVLYQHVDEAWSIGTSSPSETLSNAINTWLSEVYFNPTMSKSLKKNTIQVNDCNTNRTIVQWEETSELMALAVYPDLRHEEYPWIRNLLAANLQEYQVFMNAVNQENVNTDSSSHVHDDVLWTVVSHTNQARYDRTFQVIFQQYRTSSTGGGATTKTASIASAANSSNASSRTRGKGKEKRQWHDGDAKVTKEAMAELDRSKAVTEDEILKSEEQALAEARAAYLPTDADLQDFDIEDTTTLIDEDDDDEDNSNSTSSWGGSLSSLFAQMTGQKVLTKQDLQAPIKEMHNLLTSKNVANDIASQICNKVQDSLVGKKLNSMYRVKTAVRQALEKVINELLGPSTQLNLLRQVISKRDQTSLLFARNKNQKRPFVIVVVGINGVGKSTSLAKLAYFLKSNGCQPLLAACDTFRSGAVEQLSVHAKCLGLPIYSKGYAKDPSSVASAAIEQATQNGNDVVLVDTAGRMQNNLPLMKALGKLALENQPDMIVFVGEALVGNDGVDQVKMFDKAVSFQNKSHRVNSIFLTKFDTVSDKVGAALTMTHVTNAPILFVGTGQKYHHLQKLSTASVIRSLFQ